MSLPVRVATFLSPSARAVFVRGFSRRGSRFLLLALTVIIWLTAGSSLTGCGSSENSSKTLASTPEDRFAQGKAAYDKQDWLEAIRIFEEVRIQSPTSELASEATYLEAMARFHQQMFSGAATDFRAVRRNYPNSAFASRAQYMIGESYFQIAPRPELDQSYTVLALSEFQSFLRDYTTAPQTLLDSAQHRIVEIRDRLAQKAYNSAELYVKMEDPKSAIVYYNRVLDQFYDTKYAPESELRIAEIQYDRGKIDDAKTALTAFEQKYLQSASEPQRQRALKLRSHLPQS